MHGHNGRCLQYLQYSVYGILEIKNDEAILRGGESSVQLEGDSDIQLEGYREALNNMYC